MSFSLAFDTSNYTTSVAVYTGEKITVNNKIPVGVEKNRRGIRQSDAVFSHTVNLPKALEGVDGKNCDCIGVSYAPRSAEGSYMPCFLCGVAAAETASCASGAPVYKFSHQQVHIMSALYGVGKSELYYERFIAFHVSGGTTEMLLCENGIITKIGGTLDINAGQLIDRIGVKMGLDFPCGAALEKISADPDGIKTRIKNTGSYFNMSGIENLACDMLESGKNNSDVAAFVFANVRCALENMLLSAKEKYDDLPVVFAGGVSSNKYLKDYFSEKYGAYFALPEFSADNACGLAILAYNEHMGIHGK